MGAACDPCGPPEWYGNDAKKWAPELLAVETGHLIHLPANQVACVSVSGLARGLLLLSLNDLMGAMKSVS